MSRARNDDNTFLIEAKNIKVDKDFVGKKGIQSNHHSL